MDLLTHWLVAFGNESLPPPERKSFEQRRPQMEKIVENDQAYVWHLDDQPVSVAHVGRPTENGISVSAVYTPLNLRKRGYASAVVAHLSQLMLNSGKRFCVLYTDLSNPTSNKIYKDVGTARFRIQNFFVSVSGVSPSFLTQLKSSERRSSGCHNG